MRLTGFVVVVCLLVAGCRARSAPEYYEAEADYAILVARLGDGAYADPSLPGIVERLRAVPPKAREAGKARELLARIEAEAARVRAHEAQVAAELARVANPTPPPKEEPRPAKAQPAAVADGRPAPAGPRPLASLRSFPGWRSGARGYETALADQQSSGYPLVLYFGVDWCPHCKRLDSVVLPDATTVAALSTAVKVRVDPEKGEAEKRLAGQYGVTSYPTVLLFAAPSASPERLGWSGGALAEDYRARVAHAWALAAYDSLRGARLDEAIERADRLLAFAPKTSNGYGYEVRGDAFRKKGDVPAALRDYQLGCQEGCAKCCAAVR